jgi:5-amino-6-(5-phosphoribosylamino)uracil reductase
MRQLLPRPLDPVDLDVLEDRTDRIPPDDRPWVMANMVMSVDGAYAVDGRSGGLGSPGDRSVFHRLRSAADAVMAAAGTARAERYRRPRLDDAAVERRRARGLRDHPRLVLVSASLTLPDDLPLLSGEGDVPLVVHPAGAPTDAVPDGVELRAVGSGDEVDLVAAMQGLRRDGVEVLLCEGGPSLLGQLHTADLLDELFVTFSPSLVGGATVGLLGRHAALQRPVHLHRLLEEEGSLFATYRRG